MSTTPQKRALHNYRKRLTQRGMARFEVLGLDADRELIRSLARRLAGNGPDPARIRATVRLTIAGDPPAQFILSDVVFFVLRKAVNEEGTGSRPEYNQCAKSAGPPRLQRTSTVRRAAPPGRLAVPLHNPVRRAEVRDIGTPAGDPA